MAAKVESPQVATRVVAYIAVGLVAAVIASVGGLALSFPSTISRSKPVVAAFPQPAVRTDERAQRMRIEKAQRDRLVGKNGGMPIDQAMDVIAARGSAAYDPIVGAAQ